MSLTTEIVHASSESIQSAIDQAQISLLQGVPSSITEDQTLHDSQGNSCVVYARVRYTFQPPSQIPGTEGGWWFPGDLSPKMKIMEITSANNEARERVRLLDGVTSELRLSGSAVAKVLEGEVEEYTGDSDQPVLMSRFLHGYREGRGETAVSRYVFSCYGPFPGGVEKLVVGDYCFQEARCFELVGMDRIEQVRVGKYSFCRCRGDNPPLSRQAEVAREGRLFLVTRCASLRTISIGYGSFTDTVRCEVSFCDKLEALCDKLEALRSVEGSEILFNRDCWSPNRYGNSFAPFCSVRLLILRNLPSFHELVLRSGFVLYKGPYLSFCEVVLENLPCFHEFDIRGQLLFRAASRLLVGDNVPKSIEEAVVPPELEKRKKRRGLLYWGSDM